ncbi:hypothetical protein P171DRAFT_417546 [Karstenula rhodostoma CBS 690.94]|uniref:IBR domain-containing protein n=1 Tax=Karstenula rhodostoma CBS 690.94 TaxID=1392251 RepID=A0A9P4PG77_9PLEO|nr:hypothetical protein P171DRAFT_417546 [Karstenula rhodostoma CBS 690.94]
MDPDSARLALDLQLQDVNDALETLNAGSEAAAFRVLRDELIRKRSEIDGQCAAIRMLRTEYGERSVHRRLLAEERQAQGDHAIAARLAGRTPIPQPALPVARPPDEPLNGSVAVPLAVDLGIMQTGYAVPGNPRKRRAKEDSEALRDRSEGGVKRRWVPQAKDCSLADGRDATPKNATKDTALGIPRKRPAEEDSETLRDRTEGCVKRRWVAEKKARNSTDKSDVTAEKTNRRANSLAETDEPAIKWPLWSPAWSFQKCSGCFELFAGADVLELQCPTEELAAKHAYCKDCLQSIFEHAIADSDQFPPRCCQPLELSSCMRLLAEDIVSQFRDKKEELETPDRTYCSMAECAKWIKRDNTEAGVATCPRCAQKTCANCKQKQHEGLCPTDSAVKALLTLAEKKQCKSCPQCKNMVELTVGCYHITYVLPGTPLQALGEMVSGLRKSGVNQFMSYFIDSTISALRTNRDSGVVASISSATSVRRSGRLANVSQRNKYTFGPVHLQSRMQQQSIVQPSSMVLHLPTFSVAPLILQLFLATIRLLL